MKRKYDFDIRQKDKMGMGQMADNDKSCYQGIWQPERLLRFETAKFLTL